MSRTRRNVIGKKLTPMQKLGGSKHKACLGHKSSGKYAVGPGGLNCPCCTKLPPDELKVKERRLNRRKTKIQDNLKKYEEEE